MDERFAAKGGKGNGMKDNQRIRKSVFGEKPAHSFVFQNFLVYLCHIINPVLIRLRPKYPRDEK